MRIGKNNTRARVAVCCLMLLLGSSLSAAVQAEEEFTDVYRLGRATTRFSPDSAVEFSEFQRQFALYREDYEKVLTLAGWDGDRDALFAAVANAKEGPDGAVSFLNGEPGTILQWMALRRKGEPAIIKNVRWAAKVPFPAWEITVDNGDRRTIFVVPQWCMNLALVREETIKKKPVVAVVPPPPPPPSPECRITAMVTEDGMIEIDASGSQGAVEIQGMTLPDDSAGDLGQLMAAGEGIWSFDASETLGRKPGDYRYTFEAVARLSNEEAICEAEAVVTKMKPEGRWIFRGFVDGVSRGHSEDFATAEVDDVLQTEKLHVLCGFGLGVGLEYMATDLVGIDARIQYNQVDASLVADRGAVWELDGQNLEFLPITLAANFHLTPDRLVDFYIGPMVGWASFSSTNFKLFGGTVSYDWDSAFGYGLQTGLDIPFGDGSWSFTSGLSFMFMDTKVKSRDIELGLDPFTTMVGVAYRF